ncbi:MAG: metal-dependent transcriptional regulator [Chloroflexota bacterium]|nr:metal-dependent transcriptional regulator [Chloroflexota bacterium]
MTPDRTQSNTSAADMRLSMAAENYLLSIYQLEELGRRVTPSQLAEQLKRLPEGEGLGTSLPSVTGMLRRLSRERLIEMDKNKEIDLTKLGREAAESIVRRHRLAELLVVDVLDVDLYNAHEEAHRLEHAMSPLLEEKIRRKLGDPKTSPFGDPIPGSGHAVSNGSVLLSTAKQGHEYTVDRIPEDDQALLEYLVPYGFIPGRRVKIIEAAPYRGVIRLECDGEEVVVGYEVAERIWLRLAD